MKDSVWLKVAVPTALKEDFKIACWLKGTTQTDQMLTMMHEEVVANKRQIEEAKKVRNP